MQVFTAYVRKLIAERAREEYSALVESTGNVLQDGRQPHTGDIKDMLL